MQVWNVPILNDTAVLKTIRIDKKTSPHKAHERHRIDAVILERLASNPCLLWKCLCCLWELNIIQKASQTLTKYIKQIKVVNQTRNNLLFEQLRLAREVSRALSILHSMGLHPPHNRTRHTTVAMTDIKMDNFMLLSNGQTQINDLNLAILLRHKDGKPCGYKKKEPGLTASFQVTPERWDKRMDHVAPVKLNVFGLGRVLLGILLLHDTKFDQTNDYSGHHKIVSQRPFANISDSTSREIAIQAMLHASLACLAAKPEDRPNSFQTAQGLGKWARENKWWQNNRGYLQTYLILLHI